MEIVKSKKFIAAILSSIIAFYGVYNGWTPDQMFAVIGPLMTYILGQGIADHGKEKAKIEHQYTALPYGEAGLDQAQDEES